MFFIAASTLSSIWVAHNSFSITEDEAIGIIVGLIIFDLIEFTPMTLCFWFGFTFISALILTIIGLILYAIFEIVMAATGTDEVEIQINVDDELELEKLDQIFLPIKNTKE